MSPWSALSGIVGALFVICMIPYAISSHMEIMALWKRLRENHYRKWIALGGHDALSETFITRGFGSMRKTYEALEDVEDDELQEIIVSLKRHERFAAIVLLPMFLVLLLLFFLGEHV